MIHCLDCCSSSGSNCYLSIQCCVITMSKWLPSGTNIQMKINHLPQYYQCFFSVFIMLFLSPIATDWIQHNVIKFVSDLRQVSLGTQVSFTNKTDINICLSCLAYFCFPASFSVIGWDIDLIFGIKSSYTSNLSFVPVDYILYRLMPLWLSRINSFKPFFVKR